MTTPARRLVPGGAALAVLPADERAARTTASQAIPAAGRDVEYTSIELFGRWTSPRAGY